MSSRITSTLAAIALAAAISLTGCGDDQPEQTPAEQSAPEQSAAEHGGHDHGEAGHAGHDHPEDGGPPPAGIEEVTDATYPVGTQVILTADHMPGMNGAEATIVGAYRTHTYAIDYTPTDGGEPVTNHKWVVQEEIKDAGEDLIPDGEEVTVEADHMSGMQGATATIASSTDETVYIVDVVADGMSMRNHKWVVESEIKPIS